LMFTQTPKSQTLPIIVASFTSDFTISFSFINAAGVIAIIPPVILAVAFERYIVSGLTAGAVKGLGRGMARIRFDGVSKRSGDVVGERSLSLDIGDGDFVVVLGPAGGGKSTALNVIAGLEKASGGELWFDNEVVNRIPPHHRNVAMVFQSYALY